MLKKDFKGIFLIPLFFTACFSAKKNGYNPAKKYGSVQLREDLTTLQKILEHHHPSLYWYTPKDSMDAIFAETFTSLNDSLTEAEFKNKVAIIASDIRCGHTSVRNSKEAAKYFKDKKLPQFPLSIKLWNDSGVVVTNIFAKNSPVKKGTPVLSINGKSITAITDSIFRFLGSDGYAYNFKYQVASNNFPAHYRNAFGLDSQYVIQYVDSTGQKKETVIKNYIPPKKEAKKDSLTVKKPIEKKPVEKKSRQEKLKEFRTLDIDTTTKTAFLNLHTFSRGKLLRFFHRSFREMLEKEIKNLVIDLRRNGGGDVFTSTRLTQYLADKPFNIADTVAAFRRSFPYKKNVKPWFLYWLSMHFTGKRQMDGRVHFTYFEKHFFPPKKRKHFYGDIYIVTGGYTFSAATLVTGTLKGQKNVTVLGEETGGGSYGNSAMHLPVITLPNTRIRVSLPLYRLVIDKEYPKTGRGIIPDVEVLPSSQAIKNGIDTKMEKVKELIKKRNTLSGN